MASTLTNIFGATSTTEDVLSGIDLRAKQKLNLLQLTPGLIAGGGRRFSHALVPISLSAVSEAPTSEELGVETLQRALQIQRLEGSRPVGLWDLYLDEPVLTVGQCAVAMRALGFQQRLAERRLVGGASESTERTTILHFEECETENRSARRSTSEIRGWRCGFMRRTG